jgi:hypothetical protein
MVMPIIDRYLIFYISVASNKDVESGFRGNESEAAAVSPAIVPVGPICTLATDVPPEMVMPIIDRYLIFYIRTADKLQRTARSPSPVVHL